jgi:hypothetical protein
MRGQSQGCQDDANWLRIFKFIPSNIAATLFIISEMSEMNEIMHPNWQPWQPNLQAQRQTAAVNLICWRRAGPFFIQPCAIALLWVFVCWAVGLNIAGAAEFGEPVVTSFVGQPLIAEVELTALSEEDGAALQVHLAPLDVYREANVKFDPVLSSLHFMLRRHDHRQFIRISSSQAIKTAHVILFLDLIARNDHAVRALTLWLDADPNAASGSALTAASVPVSAYAPGSVAATALAAIPSVNPGSGVTTTPVLDRVGHSINNAANNTAKAPMPTQQEIELLVRAMAPPLGPGREARHGVVAGGLSAPSSVGKRSCRILSNVPASQEQIQRCIAAERENRVISAHIQELEKSVVILRKVMEGNPDAAVVTGGGASSPTLDSAVKPIAAKPHTVKKAVAQTTPWLMIGLAGLGLLVAGGGSWLVSRRRKGKVVKLPAKPASSPTLMRRLSERAGRVTQRISQARAALRGYGGQGLAFFKKRLSGRKMKSEPTLDVVAEPASQPE